MQPNARTWRDAALLAVATLALHAGAAPARDAPGPVRTEIIVARAAPPSGSIVAEDLGRIVYSITTVIEYPDGRQGLRRGSGFVVGSRFYTVNHNLVARSGASAGRRTIYIDGSPVRPAVVDAVQDIAIFDLPPALCARICNALEFGPMPELETHEKIFWLRKFGAEREYKDARVLSFVVVERDAPDGVPRSPAGCERNVVVEVDVPFVHGTSGSPVIDARSGRVVGIAQGSFEYEGVRTGYFKPIDCVRLLGSTIDSPAAGPA